MKTKCLVYATWATTATNVSITTRASLTRVKNTLVPTQQTTDIIAFVPMVKKLTAPKSVDICHHVMRSRVVTTVYARRLTHKITPVPVTKGILGGNVNGKTIASRLIATMEENV